MQATVKLKPTDSSSMACAVGSRTAWQVTVMTSDVRGAGTDANVYLNIVAERGESGERRYV
jgi:hypothetical protein